MNRKDRRHLNLLRIIGDLTAVLTGSGNLEGFLDSEKGCEIENK